jgi:hypothetical protein
VQVAPYPGGPVEASRLQDILNNYEDIYTAINRQLELFAVNNGYLVQALSVFTPSALLNQGIYFNQNLTSPPVVNPIMIVNSNYAQDWILLTKQLGSPPTPITGLVLLGTTQIGRIVVEGNVGLWNLYIGPGVVVDVLDSSAAGAYVYNLWMPYLKDTPSTLNKIAYGSSVLNFHIDDGSYFGGVSNDDPNSPCVNPVGNLTATQITDSSILLSWTKPVNPYLFINLFYRLSNTATWITVQGQGQYTDDTNFVIRDLEHMTYYDFMVQVVCTNGGVNTQTLLNVPTVCCGGGSGGGGAITGLVEMIDGNDINTSIGNNTYTMVFFAEYGFTINELRIIAASGTATAAVKIGGTNVTGMSAVAVSNIATTATATGANTVAVGNTVTLVLSSTAALTNLQWTLKLTRT